MALGNRYTFSFFSLIDSEQFTITIKQEGYAGPVETLEFLPGRSPLVLSYDKNNANILHPIRGSQMTVSVSLQPSQIQEFILAGNRDWYIEVTGTNGFEWYGWLQPQNSMLYTPYGLKELQLQFSDNLGALQNTPDNVFESSFIALQTIQEMIERQVGYTDISLPYVFNTSVRHDDETDPIQETTYLEQIMCLDFNGVEPQMAYNLLSKELRLLQSAIYQKQGNWVIENLIDKSFAPYPASLFDTFKIVGRGLTVRFESPLSKVTAKSYHYNTRHSISNRDFTQYVTVGPNQGFVNWEQFGTLATVIYSQVIISGISYFGVLGNYVFGVANSTDHYAQTGIPITQNMPLKLFINYNNTFSGVGQVDPRIALRFDGTSNTYYLNTDNEWQVTGTPIILTGEAAIANAASVTTQAPEDGSPVIMIYRPEVPGLGVTYNSGTSYIRYSYADFGVGKSAVDSDYKLFKSIGVKRNKGVRENEIFETIGLAFDNEFYPNATSNFDNYVCLFYDSLGSRLTGNFVSDYSPTSQPWGPTEFACNTYMRLLAKPQLYIEATLIGKGLYIGDVYEVDVPGFETPYLFAVVAYDYDIRNDTYNVLLAYIDYDTSNTITQERVWLQQGQDDPDN